MRQVIMSLAVILTTSVTVYAQETPNGVTIQLPTFEQLVSWYGPWGAFILLAAYLLYREFGKSSDHQQRKEILGVESRSRTEEALAEQIRGVTSTMQEAIKSAEESREWTVQMTQTALEKTEANGRLRLEVAELKQQLEDTKTALENAIETMHASLNQMRQEYEEKIRQINASWEARLKAATAHSDGTSDNQ